MTQVPTSKVKVTLRSKFENFFIKRQFFFMDIKYHKGVLRAYIALLGGALVYIGEEG
jgi:hypothetical protein